MANLSEEQLQELIFDTLEDKPLTLAERIAERRESRARFGRSKTSDGISRPKSLERKSSFARAQTVDTYNRKTKRTTSLGSYKTASSVSPTRSKPSRSKSSGGESHHDPAMIIKRLEKLAASDDSNEKAEEYLQFVKGEKKDKDKSSSRSPKPRRSSSKKLDPAEAIKIMEQYGCSKDSFEGELYLQYLKDSSDDGSNSSGSSSPGSPTKKERTSTGSRTRSPKNRPKAPIAA